MEEDPAILRFKALAAKFEAMIPPEEKAAAEAQEDIPDDFAPEDTRGYRVRSQESRRSRSTSPRKSRSRSRSRSPRKKKHDSSDSDSGPELVTSQTYGRKIDRKASSRGRGGFGGSRGPPRSSSVKTIKIPNDKVSIIIGKGGSQIKEIQSTTGAQIKIPDATYGSADRDITIIGSDEQQQRAIDTINQIIQDRAIQRGPGGGGGRGGPGGPSGGGGPGFRNEIKFEMQIPSDRVGLVIGKQGATINEIKQQSGAHISVQREPSSGPTTQVIISAKTQEAIDHARQLIDEKTSGNREGGRGGPRGGGRYTRESYEQDQSRYGRDSYDQDQGRYGRDSYDQEGGHGGQQYGQPQPPSETIGDWTSCVDPKSGYTYWANLKTGETTWDRPSQ